MMVHQKTEDKRQNRKKQGKTRQSGTPVTFCPTVGDKAAPTKWGVLHFDALLPSRLQGQTSALECNVGIKQPKMKNCLSFEEKQ